MFAGVALIPSGKAFKFEKVKWPRDSGCGGIRLDGVDCKLNNLSGKGFFGETQIRVLDRFNVSKIGNKNPGDIVDIIIILIFGNCIQGLQRYRLWGEPLVLVIKALLFTY